jgi:hypothetical protein
MLQIGYAGLIGREPVEKLAPRSRIILPCNRTALNFFHGPILAQVELSGYALGIYSILVGCLEKVVITKTT